jgi:hypothetical protein
MSQSSSIKEGSILTIFPRSFWIAFAVITAAVSIFLLIIGQPIYALIALFAGVPTLAISSLCILGGGGWIITLVFSGALLAGAARAAKKDEEDQSDNPTQFYP